MDNMKTIEDVMDSIDYCLAYNDDNLAYMVVTDNFVQNTLKEAADIIARLVTERDEMKYLLKQFLPYLDDACGFCVHRNAKPSTAEFTENCDTCNESQHYCCWTYGGIPHRINKYFEIADKLKNGFYKGCQEHPWL